MYLEHLRQLSDRLVAIQKPIMILDAIKWPAQVQTEFLEGKGKTLPNIDQAFYEQQALRFAPDVVREELKTLRSDICRLLGGTDGLGRILLQNIEQYLLVIDMLEGRGTKAFGVCSQALYGSATDKMRGDKKTLLELSERLCRTFSSAAAEHLKRPYGNDIPAEKAVEMLSAKLNAYFNEGDIRVQLSNGIVSDAAAGGDVIKLNERAYFSELDLQVLEVHEGWVHVGTTLNGRRQPYATWLGVGSPRITAHQEGLAVLMETLTFSSFPQRARRVSDRVVAISLAEDGADFVEVYRHFIDKGLSEHDSYRVTQRVFRGGCVEGGSVFTKDLSYIKGFVENVNFIKSAIESGVPEILPMMFVGKVTLDDLPILYERYLEGVIAAPDYLPPMFRDLNGLFVWFGFSSGMSLVNLGRVQAHYSDVFAKLPHTTPVYTTQIMTEF
ncbi:flavohemoglobin expression-modulating QEGLA motif protein [Nitrincola alkalisediminis]|uniref:flavohemoglobin expression-modulating QEGLA motif protein n=1 Tax=Nitrincola alkalisediminis TaxID=1366656 RepID=UPI001876E669|nr:flavohemoglobin expression-modulating QEGLA motif protein [Nitrincola alkalisediminis]